MAKISGPLFSFGASGTVGNMLTFNQSLSRPVARRKPSGYAPATPAQAIQRDAMSAAAVAWRALSTPTRAEWIALTNGRANTAFSKFFLEWTAQASTPGVPPYLPMA